MGDEVPDLAKAGLGAGTCSQPKKQPVEVADAVIAGKDPAGAAA